MMKPLLTRSAFHGAITAVAVLGVARPLQAQAVRVLVTCAADTTGTAVAGATVRVLEAARTARSGADGCARFAELPRTTVRVVVTRPGFRPVTSTVLPVLAASDTLRVVLHPAAVALGAVQVSATPLATRTFDAPQATATMDDAALRTARAPSLGETIARMPGVQNQSLGPEIGKPVIRGLTGNRVLVVANGQRQEFQQWGEDHAPNIELPDAAAIEVVRGPASVLYGSDALGGVANVIARPLPDALGRDAFTQARLRAGYVTNNAAPEGSIALEGARGALGWRTSLAGQIASDLHTPNGPLRNSAYDMVGGGAALGARGAWGSAQVEYSGKRERPSIAEDPQVDPLYSGYQRISTDLIRTEARMQFGADRLELGVGLQHNTRAEFASRSAAEPTTALDARTLTADARFLHAPRFGLEGAFGLSYSALTFEGGGLEPLLPAYRWHDVGLYAFEQWRGGQFDLAAGLRGDVRSLATGPSTALSLTAQRKDWTALSGNLGAVWHAAEGVALVANAGRGFRAPQPSELYANGVHQGTLAYEIGDPALDVERSLNMEVGLRVERTAWHAEFTAYRNAINGFIYYRPTGVREPRTGFEIFRFTQGRALIKGFEGSATWQVQRHLEVTAGADLSLGTNESLGTPLPFMPPLRFLYGATWRDLRVGRGVLATLGVSGEQVARQDRPDVAEVAPAAFHVLDLQGGLELPGARGPVHLDVLLRNAGDASYSRPLNRFKGFAREMGRHLVLRVTVPL